MYIQSIKYNVVQNKYCVIARVTKYDIKIFPIGPLAGCLVHCHFRVRKTIHYTNFSQFTALSIVCP